MSQQDQLNDLQYNMQVRNDRNRAGYNGLHPVDGYFKNLGSTHTRSGQSYAKPGVNYYGGSHRKSHRRIIGHRRHRKTQRRSRRRHGGRVLSRSQGGYL